MTTICHQFPLRPEYLAQVVVPSDLTREEAERLCAFLQSLAMPIDGFGGNLDSAFDAEPTQDQEVVALVRDIHRAIKRGEGTQDHGLIGNLRCILDAVSADPPDFLGAPPPPQGWQPIETAPKKDGFQAILAWDSGHSMAGFYLDNSKTSVPWAGWRVHSNVVPPPGKITHWMPLPAPTIPDVGPRGLNKFPNPERQP